MGRYNLETLKQNLHEKRIQSGLKIKELAEKVNKNIRTISDIDDITSKKYPDLKTLLDLSNFYDCDIDNLFGVLDHSKHDLKFICENTGLSENGVKLIKDLPPYMVTLLENCIKNGLLHAIAQYKFFETSSFHVQGDTLFDNVHFDAYTDKNGLYINGQSITKSVCQAAVLNDMKDILDEIDNPVFSDLTAYSTEEENKKIFAHNNQFEFLAYTNDGDELRIVPNDPDQNN